MKKSGVMRYYIFGGLISIILCTLGLSKVQASTVLGEVMDYVIVTNVDSYSDMEIELDTLKCLSSLSISGSSILYSDSSLVRVLLLDKNNNSYLVFEDYFLLHQEVEFEAKAYETAALDSIEPLRLMLIVRDAELKLDKINYSPWNKLTLKKGVRLAQKNQRVRQEEYMIDRWNEYNQRCHIPWIAGKTSLSGLTYSQKKMALGITDDAFMTDGLEYYIGGFFVVNSHNTPIDAIPQSSSVDSNQFVESFDWRNRHGKDWMTSVKNQLEPNSGVGGGGCWAFGTIAAIESAINLQYNQLLNYDLSEQELGACTSGSFGHGGWPNVALSYAKSYGIVTEECMPFMNVDTIDCSQKCSNPYDMIEIANYKNILSSNDDSLKKAIIKYGPIVSGLNNGFTNHVMCLCGYGTIKQGDSIELFPYTSARSYKVIIEEGNPLIGQTYWIYKNSYGLSNGFNGYLYAVYERSTTRDYSFAITYPILSSIYNENDVVISDNDGDGYYFWGLGDKPSYCPICCPNVPDGDDADASIGEIDSYGNPLTVRFPYDTLYITSNMDWSASDTICGNVVISSSAVLTVSATVTLNPQARIFIRDGASLVVDGGSVVNSNILVGNTGHLWLRNSAVLYMNSKDCLEIQLGGELMFDDGEILIVH